MQTQAIEKAGGTPALPEEGLPEAQYTALRERCEELLVDIEGHFLEGMWLVGQAVSDALGSGRQEWGAQAVHRLSLDLGLDHTNVYRAIQLYETYPKNQIVARRATKLNLTWRKVKMLLPLPAELRAEMEERLASGELRTDDALRQAILERKIQLGLVDATITPPRALGVTGIDMEKACTLFRRIGPNPAGVRTIVATWVGDWKRVYLRDGADPELRAAGRQALLAIAADIRQLAEETE